MRPYLDKPTRVHRLQRLKPSTVGIDVESKRQRATHALFRAMGQTICSSTGDKGTYCVVRIA